MRIWNNHTMTMCHQHGHKESKYNTKMNQDKVYLKSFLQYYEKHSGFLCSKELSSHKKRQSGILWNSKIFARAHQDCLLAQHCIAKSENYTSH